MEPVGVLFSHPYPKGLTEDSTGSHLTTIVLFGVPFTSVSKVVETSPRNLGRPKFFDDTYPTEQEVSLIVDDGS